jgi:hypothetical protein
MDAVLATIVTGGQAQIQLNIWSIQIGVGYGMEMDSYKSQILNGVS